MHFVVTVEKNSKLKTYIYLTGTILSIILMLVYSMDLKIVNSEKLFLSKDGIEKITKFEEIFTSNEFLIYEDETDFFENKIKDICEDNCHQLDHQMVKEMANEQETALKIIVSENQEYLTKIVQHIIGKKPDTNIAGASYINHLLDINSEVIGKVIFPLFFFLITIVVFLLFRSLFLAIICITPTILSAAISQAFIKVYFGSSNIIIAITPLLVSILVFTTLIHVLFQYLESGEIKVAIRKKLRPIMYMLVSTTFGLISLLFSPLKIIATFGVLSAFLLNINIILSLLFIYYYPYSDNKKNRLRIKPNKIRQFHFSNNLYFIIIGLFIICLPYLHKHIHYEVDASNYFSKKLAVKEKLKNINEKIGGAPIIDLIFKIDEKNKYDEIYRLEVIEKEISNLLEKKIISSNILVQKANKVYQGSSSIPDTMMAYLPLYYQTPEIFRDLYPIDKEYRLSILGTHISGDEYNALIEKLNKYKKDNNLNFELNGKYYWLMEAQESLINTLIYSFGFTLAVISLFVIFLFGGLKNFITFISINIYPILIFLYLLPIIGISLNIATVMSFSISIGLMVDSTFHLFFERKSHDSIRMIHPQTILPIFWSNIILGSIFLLFGFIDFLPIRQFGLSMSILIFIGLLFDLFILPKLLNFKN